MLYIFNKTLSFVFIILTLLTHQNVLGTEVPLQEELFQYPTLYHTAEPQRLRQALEDAMTNAKQSILIFTFSFSDQDFINLINQKANEGLDVMVVIDKNHLDPLLYFRNDKVRILTREYGEGRVHHKILVIDYEDIWLGSANFSSSAFDFQENLVIQVKSKNFAKALYNEAEVFQNKHKRIDHTTPIETIGDQEIFLYLLPHSDPYYLGVENKLNEYGKQTLISLIKNAKNHIRIAMMVWTDPELEKAILDAHARGVTVEVLLQDLEDLVARRLQQTGIFITNNPNLHFMHNKWMWIDEKILVNGSANWSRSSFSRNDESFFVLKNLNDIQNSYLKKYWTNLLTR